MTNRILKVFATGADQELIAQQVDVLERYDAFLLADVAPSAATDLARSHLVEDITDLYQIPIGAEAIDTSIPRLDSKGVTRRHPAYRRGTSLSAGPHHYIVQFIGPVKDQWLRGVKRAGASCESSGRTSPSSCARTRRRSPGSLGCRTSAGRDICRMKSGSPTPCATRSRAVPLYAFHGPDCCLACTRSSSSVRRTRRKPGRRYGSSACKILVEEPEAEGARRGDERQEVRAGQADQGVGEDPRREEDPATCHQTPRATTSPQGSWARRSARRIPTLG